MQCIIPKNEYCARNSCMCIYKNHCSQSLSEMAWNFNQLKQHCILFSGKICQLTIVFFCTLFVANAELFPILYSVWLIYPLFVARLYLKKILAKVRAISTYISKYTGAKCDVTFAPTSLQSPLNFILFNYLNLFFCLSNFTSLLP